MPLEFGCYCGLQSTSNKWRWAGVAAFFLASFVPYGLALAELAKCNRPCAGDERDLSLRVRKSGVYVFRCSPTANTSGAIRPR